MDVVDRAGQREARHLPIALDRDAFLRRLFRHLTGSLQELVGVHELSGLLSMVGQQLGEEIDEAYRGSLGVTRLGRAEVSDVLVDLKRQIGGDFRVISQDDDRIVLGNRACPFGSDVVGRPVMCMMTSNVFGVIAAQNLGYARVVIEEAIANGDPGCRVVLHIAPDAADEEPLGREYFRKA